MPYLLKKKSLSEWLKYIENINVKRNVINLKSVKKLANKINVINFSSFVFLVGGTNGKGTTCNILERLLLSSGYTVGLYTSPHLLKYSERVRINGKTLSDDCHIRAFSYIDFIRNNIALTYFEFITLSSLFLFKEQKLDIVILEVGLGGRLDATNVVNADLSVITNIGIEHTKILGLNRELIGFEKAHIAKKNKVIIIGDKDIPNSMYNVIKTKKTILKKINYDWFIKKSYKTWNYIASNMLLYNLSYPKLSLSNVAIALTALFYSPFKVNENIIRYTITHMELIGRFQVLSYFPTVILDVAHNPNATLYLYKKLKFFYQKGKIHAIVGILKDKDIQSMIFNLKELVHYWYFAPVKSSRSYTISEMYNILPNSFKIFNNVKNAWKMAKLKSQRKDIILVFGSFLVVEEIIHITNA